MDMVKRIKIHDTLSDNRFKVYFFCIFYERGSSLHWFLFTY